MRFCCCLVLWLVGYDALLLFGVVVGRLNKHTTPKRKEKKKRNSLCNCKEHQIYFKEDAWRVQKEEKGDKAFR
jgi:beta-lactamase regulating signal transducer with metallopeptidase domain